MATNSGFSSLLKRWITSTDSVLLFSVFIIIAIGAWISIASTPAVAIKLGLPPFHFVKHHLLIVPISVFTIVFVSFLQARHIRRISVFGYLVCLILVAGTLVLGEETKGASRWLSIFGFSLQPSEFLKPVLSVMTAWFIAEQYRDRRFPGIFLSLICVSITMPLLLLQPDIGMAAVVLGTWVAQLFISGLSTFMIGTFMITTIGLSAGAYFIFPHVADRFDRFMLRGGEDDADLYQIHKSLEAFKSGGLFGKGPGEGVVKTLVPDAHSDFVFSVIGEEFGLIMCLALITLYIVIIVRTIGRLMRSSSIFSFSAVFGILFQTNLQVLINICTSLNLMPTKGMTLPFISYGGSSMLASSVSVGILLALTKRNAIIKESL
ncbi:MAG: putative lipid II flippase FtsW [Holosporales bacterium]|jgi:cell division protein FtsW|nr:putative lipid II flippase FtsW [Holosporales bacterium]